MLDDEREPLHGDHTNVLALGGTCCTACAPELAVNPDPAVRAAILGHSRSSPDESGGPDDLLAGATPVPPEPPRGHLVQRDGPDEHPAPRTRQDEQREQDGDDERHRQRTGRRPAEPS
jgi:hypothetical protein